MSVTIQNLTKIYGSQRAVNAITFEAPKGMITGFLGPNGAGKSTTMKLATGYIQPTEGQIELEGVRVFEDPMAAKRMTGYLPEHNPLYLDMYVGEFLSFVGSAYKLKNLTRRVNEMIGLCGLELERSKKIGALSKGYRQRVGLAQALIHDPKVLILDEPTSGLDPNQLLEIRGLIKEMSQDKTVIFSTHIMQEVEALCDKVVIINRGNLVADDLLTNLKAGVQKSGFIVEFEEAIDISLFEKKFTIREYGPNKYLVESSGKDLRAELLKLTSKNNLPLVSLSKAEQSLEEIFHSLTQKGNS